MKEPVKIITPNGIGHIEEIYLSELGFLMIRVHLVDESTWTSYNLGTHNIYDNIFSKILLPTKWLHQYVKSDKLWHLSEHHPTNGVLTELFFETEVLLLKYLTQHNIISKNEIN